MFIVTFWFDGSFPVNCEENYVPRSLVALVSMLLYGQYITTDSYKQETLTIAWIFIFNSYKRILNVNSPKIRHHASKETYALRNNGSLSDRTHEINMLLSRMEALLTDNPVTLRRWMAA